MKACKRIFLILCIYVVTAAILQAAVFYIEWLGNDSAQVYWETVLIIAALIVATQCVFLIPIVHPPTVSLYGKSLKVSFVIAAFLASISSMVLLLGIFSFVTSIVLQSPKEDTVQPWVFWAVLGCTWLCWSIFLLKFVMRKNHDATPLVRVTGLLFAGTVVEVLLSIPLAIMVERRSNCYCENGSFFALVFSIIAAFWLFGPCMVMLLFWRKRPWIKDHCLQCGYPRKVANVDTCSECGCSL
ncbi:MAG: hypothetical protein HOK75_08175 [Phycisphaerae bacterium]|nr:hypothetical protein [Phycisphaerae bacterium]